MQIPHRAVRFIARGLMELLPGVPKERQQELEDALDKMSRLMTTDQNFKDLIALRASELLSWIKEYPEGKVITS